MRDAFRRTPCTRNGHHAYLGGLLEHTVAVATLARELCDLHRRLNSDLLLTAAIVHDLGRMREFTYGAEIGLTEQGRLLGHLALGQQMLVERFALLGARAAPTVPPSTRAEARAPALRAQPPRRLRRARWPLRLTGGASALPCQRARRRCQGRAGTWDRSRGEA